MNLPRSISHRLAWRLALCIVALSVAYTAAQVLFTLSSRNAEFLQDKDAQLEEIASANLRSLANSLWKMDDRAVALQLEGISRLPDVEMALVEAEDGTAIVAGMIRSTATMERVYPLEYDFRGGTLRLGGLRVVLGLDGARAEMRAMATAEALSAMGRTLLLVCVLLLVFYRMVARHLYRMAAYARGLTVNALEQPLTLERDRPSSPDGDELDQLAHALETMRGNIAASVRELQASNAHLLQEMERRQAAEVELRATRAFLRNIVDSMPSVLIGLSEDLSVTHWNALAARLTGVSVADALGRPLAEVFPSLIPFQEQMLRAMEQRQSVERRRLSLELDSGPELMDLVVYPLAGEHVQGVVVRLDDAAERARLEDVLVQSEKMASLGGLAAGMAHEINNPLAGVLQNAQSLGRRLDPGLPANERVARDLGLDLTLVERYLTLREIPLLLDGVRQAGERAARIVTNMLAFARRSPRKHTPQNLAAIMDEALELAGSDYDMGRRYDFRRIAIVREYQPDMPDVPCSPQEVEQVLLNLLKNAAQAMSLAPEPRPEPVIRVGVRQQEGFAVLVVGDNGPGMSEAVRRKIFEPFFTTKEQGQGTGLGLSVSYFIISQNHGGSISVESAPGRGTTFLVRLPLGGAASASSAS